MHVYVAATLRHLKDALIHLHDARLIVVTVDQQIAANLDVLIRGTREEIRHLDQINQPESQS